MRLLLTVLMLVTFRLTAATYYVNATGGDDSRTTAQASNPATPWLTLMGAEAKAATGDIVNVSSGTYTENDATYHCWVSTKGITWSATGLVIVKATSGANRVFWWYPNDLSSSITGFTLDAEGTYDYVLRNRGTNKVVSDCLLKGGKVYGIANEASGKDIIVTNCTLYHSGTLEAVIDLGNTFSFVHNIVNQTNSVGKLYGNVGSGVSGSTHTLAGNVWHHEGTSVASAFKIYGVPFNVVFTSNAITASTLFNGNMIDIIDQPSVQVVGNTIDVSAGSAALTPISVTSSGASASSPNISSNTVLMRALGGYGIIIGGDSSTAGDNKLNSATILGNKLYGSVFYDTNIANCTTHGILYGHNTNAVISGNYVNGTLYGIVVKHDGVPWSSGSVDRNVIVNCSGAGSSVAGIYLKGAQNVPVVNNTIYSVQGLAGYTVGLRIDQNGSGQYATGTAITNNAIVIEGTTNIIIGVGSLTGLSANNNLWSGTVIFSVEGANKTWAEWQGLGYDSSGRNANPLFRSTKNFYPVWTSPLVDSGTVTMFMSDYSGNPIVGTPDIGAYEYQHRVIPLVFGARTFSIPE